MDNQELLQAMQAMMKEEISGLRQEMTANNKSLRQEMGQMMDEKIDSLRQDMNAKFDAIDSKFDAIEVQLADIKEDTAITRSATNSLIEWAEDVGVVTQVKFPIKKAK